MICRWPGGHWWRSAPASSWFSGSWSAQRRCCEASSSTTNTLCFRSTSDERCSRSSRSLTGCGRSASPPGAGTAPSRRTTRSGEGRASFSTTLLATRRSTSSSTGAQLLAGEHHDRHVSAAGARTARRRAAPEEPLHVRQPQIDHAAVEALYGPAARSASWPVPTASISMSSCASSSTMLLRFDRVVLDDQQPLGPAAQG